MRKIKEQIALWMFNRLFRYYTYPFNEAEQALLDLSELEKQRYAQQVSEWVQSKAYKLEMQGIIRGIYQEMATKSQSKLDTTAYRLTLVALKRMDQRYREIDKQYQAGKYNEIITDITS